MTNARSPAPFYFSGVAFFIPFALSILFADQAAGFLDEGEFVAQARSLGISHPPGQPLPGLLFALASLIPAGSIAFRVAILSGIANALSAIVLFRASEHAAEHAGLDARPPRFTLSLAVALFATVGPAAFIQAIRPEVYALAGLFVALVVERTLAFIRRGDERSLLGAALGLGLLGSTHPYLAVLLALPIGIFALRTLGRSRVTTARVLGAGLLGLLPLAYLPLRAISRPALNFGDPSNLANFFWVISAKAFQKSLGPGLEETTDSRFVDVLMAVFESVSPVAFIVAIAGALLLLRERPTRPISAFLLFATLLTMVGRGALGFTKNNPDALGYLLPAIFGVALLLGAFIALLLAGIPDELGFAPKLRMAFAILTLLGPIALGASAAREFGRRGAAESLVFDEFTRLSLPAHAVVFAYNPQTIFSMLGYEAEERSRPDLLLVPVPLLFYPGLVEALLREEPALRDSLRSYLLTGQFGRLELMALAIERPVFVELDPRVDPSLFDVMVPAGLLHRVLGEGSSAEDFARGERDQLASIFQLRTRLGPREGIEPRAREQLLLKYYNFALYYGATGARESARIMARDGLVFAPRSPELLGLLDEARNEERGPIDITPYRLP